MVPPRHLRRRSLAAYLLRAAPGDAILANLPPEATVFTVTSAARVRLLHEDLDAKLGGIDRSISAVRQTWKVKPTLHVH